MMTNPAHSAHSTDRKETLMTQNQNTAGRIVFAPAAYDPLLSVVVWEMTNRLVAICHGAAAHAGWWKNPKTGDDPRDNPMCFAQKLCLIHSEISEAMEGDRKSLKDDKLPHRDMCEVELADTVIRCFDLAGALGYDLGGAIAEKLVFNSTREDHKLEVRAAAGGKAY